MAIVARKEQEGTLVHMEEITILGEDINTGAYLLRLSIFEDITVRFGRFKKGQPILVQKGTYSYIGSAMGKKGAVTLAHRLLRHATRRNPDHPQEIRESLLLALKKAGMGPENLRPPSQKKLFWNIDYLLEERAVTISHIIILRSRSNHEDVFARYLMDQPGSSIVVKGLGAQDKKGKTHLLMIEESNSWWQQLPAKLGDF